MVYLIPFLHRRLQQYFVDTEVPREAGSERRLESETPLSEGGALDGAPLRVLRTLGLGFWTVAGDTFGPAVGGLSPDLSRGRGRGLGRLRDLLWGAFRNSLSCVHSTRGTG